METDFIAKKIYKWQCYIPFVALITSKKLLFEGLTIFAIIVPTTLAFKNEKSIP